MSQPQRKSPAWTTKMLATGAVLIAMSFLLSFLKLFSMPAGGSVTAASMLPLMLFGWLYGVVPGIVAGAAYGMLQFIQGPSVVHWVQLLFDYPLAFAALGLAGAFRKTGRAWALPAGVALACFARFVCHLFTGMVFFAEYAPASDFVSVFVYSAVYNGQYMGIEALISATIAAMPPVQGMLKRIERM